MGSIERGAAYVGSLVVSGGGEMMECFFKMVILYLPDFLKCKNNSQTSTAVTFHQS